MTGRAFALAFALAAGCGSGSDGGGDGAPAATFTEIYDMFFPSTTNARCNFCHSMRASDISNGRLSYATDRDAAYAALVGKKSTSSKCGGKTLVDPGHPENSLLLDKLSPMPSCGIQMPNGGTKLTDAQLEMVRSWIEAGAPND